MRKKLIFIPVNADLHWSLLVVVNPGLIANVYNDDLPETEEHSFILFLDSLKMHNKKKRVLMKSFDLSRLKN